MDKCEICKSKAKEGGYAVGSRWGRWRGMYLCMDCVKQRIRFVARCTFPWKDVRGKTIATCAWSQGDDVAMVALDALAEHMRTVHPSTDGWRKKEVVHG